MPDQAQMKPEPAATSIPERMQVLWNPFGERFDRELQRRHLPPQAAWKVLHEESFASTSFNQVPAWTLRGGVEAGPFTLAGITGLELRSRAVGERGSLERTVPAAPLAGRIVRLDLRLACTSQPQADALKGVRVSVEARDLAGRLQTLPLPLQGGVSPGWETESFYLRFDPALGAVTIRIDFTQPAARLAIAGLRLLALPELPEGRLTGSALSGPINLLVDGDFETRQPRFFASGTRRLPGGDSIATPVLWEYVDDALFGRTALWLMQEHETYRVGFGALDLTRSMRPGETRSIWYLSFYARSSSPGVIQTTLRDRWHTSLGRHEFQTSSAWSLFSCTFLTEPGTFIDRAELAQAELLLDFAPQSPGTRVEHWLDGVALTQLPMGRTERDYARSGVYEIGLSGPPAPSFDLAGLIDESEQARCTVRILADARATRSPSATQPVADEPGSSSASSTAQLALDIVDAWDRPIWTRTTPVDTGAQRMHEEDILVALPRGYYRVLATVWSNQPESSEILSHSQLPLAVIDKNDAIPRNGRYGLTTSGGVVSLHTTHLGAGWIRIDLASRQSRTGQERWEFTFWNELMSRAAMGRLDVIVGLTLPSSHARHVDFIRAWLSDSSNTPWAMVISPPSVAANPAAEYFNQLSRIGNALRDMGRNALVVRDLTATGLDPSNVSDIRHLIAWPIVGYSCAPTYLPEHTEPLLQAISRHVTDADEIWDLRVPARLSEPPAWNNLLFHTIEPPQLQPVILLHAPVDPQIAASRLVRGLLIRGLAGASRVCSAACALEPVRSIHQPSDLRLHTLDHSPRPALVALDWMTSLLNRAELRRWIDHPGGCRLLVYAHDDGRRIVAMWRPYGLSTTHMIFPSLPESTVLYDIMGQKQDIPRHANGVAIGLNEMVQYLVVSREQADALDKQIDLARIETAAILSPSTATRSTP